MAGHMCGYENEIEAITQRLTASVSPHTERYQISPNKSLKLNKTPDIILRMEENLSVSRMVIKQRTSQEK